MRQIVVAIACVFLAASAHAVRELVVIEEPQPAQRVEGIVLNPTGAPIADMTVTDRAEGCQAVLRSTKTDGKGHFRFPRQHGKTQLAAVLARWEAKSEKPEAVLPIEEIEQREFARALMVFNGDVCAAAKALGIGKTTLYRKMKTWGFSVSDWRLIFQAAASGGSPHLS